MLYNVQIHAKVFEFGAVKGLSENISSHVASRDKNKGKLNGSNGLTNEVEMHVNVLRSTVESGVLGKADGSLIVAVKGGWE